MVNSRTVRLYLRPRLDEIDIMYSPYPTSSNFEVLNAAYTGKLDRLKMKVACADDKKEGLAKTFLRLVDGAGRIALHFAAAGGRLDVCRYLVEELNIDADLKDDDSLTPLIYGAVKGHLSVVEYLLEKGANPEGASVPNRRINTPLHYAVLGGNTKVQSLLLSKGIPIDAVTEGGTALSFAAVYGRLDAVKVLLDHHADPNVVLIGVPVPTPLTASVINNALQTTTIINNNSLEIMDLLLQAGADPNVESCGIVPLLYAVDQGLTQFTLRLLEAGADPNVTDDDWMTALEIAAKEGNSEIVEILFPVASCIPTYPNWTIGGLMEHVHSEAGKKKKKEPEGLETFLQGKKNATEAFQEKDYSLAAMWYSKALEVAPTDAKLLSNRSACYACMQDGPNALKDATKCISLRPGWPKAYYRKGVALNILKRYDEAGDAFIKGLKLDPENKELVDAFRGAYEARLEAVIAQP